MTRLGRIALTVGGALLAACGGGQRPGAPIPIPPPLIVPEPPAPAVLPPDTGLSPLRLALNIPTYQLEVFHGEMLVRRYRVAVGDSSYPTPIGQFTVARVEWDPWWTPPRSEWAQGDTVTPPGPTNPMGRVKLWFRGLYFIHGTARGQSLGTAASHGCVRLSNNDAVELASMVQQYGSSELMPTQLDSLAAQSGSGNTRRFDLSRPVLLQLRYEVVDVRQDSVILYPDIYGIEGQTISARVVDALARAGLDTTALDSARVNALELPKSGRRVFLMKTLRRPAAPAPLAAPRH